MAHERERLVSEESNHDYGAFVTDESGKRLCLNATQDGRGSIEKHQKRLVEAVLVCALFVIVITITWGVVILLARSDPVTDLPPSYSKEGHYTRAAVSADSTVCPPIGRSVLEKGGSAVDAAVAVLLCQGVSDPLRSGLGGGIFMLIYQRSSRTVLALDASVSVPARASRDMFQDDTTRQGRGGWLVAVPGELIGLWEAHKKFGVLPWSELVETAIQLCEQGVAMSENLAKFLHKFQDVVLADPALRKTFTRPGTGELLQAGDVMKNVRLARTLRVVATQGADSLYNGTLAKALVDDVKSSGGLLRMKDLAKYKPRWSKAVTTTLQAGGQKLHMHTTPPPSGGVVVSHILSILEGYNMSSQDFATVSRQVTTLHRIVEAFKLSFAKRPLLGDPEDADVIKAVQDLLSKKVVEQERQMINDNKSISDITYYGPQLEEVEDSATTHVCVLAHNGDAVSVTSSMSVNFGSGFMSSKTGIILNNVMENVKEQNIISKHETVTPSANFVSPTKHSMSPVAPSVFTDEAGDIRLIIGGTGGIKTITSIAYVAIRNLWLGDSVKTAIDARRIHHQLSPNKLQYEYGLIKQQIEGLKKRQHIMVRVRDCWSSFVNAIEKRMNGMIIANSDYRKGGTVDGLD
ncbi:gamma-glutamyltranspeptidase 1-like [Zootermopsis nevadensis]|uniref:Gamma-glutamyltranspeptidase 1 n=1 Tax=Zootermopsis nevadensis TaxID=136037 RepID=A0A067QYY9_ZOONE|nr:gamma-glutamyltranspeptidase 1-like [Zootermopsis nevadensis]KDR15760.1 Gamma-glutamyltranspeptidase 1 [Zootermopsis nevadensis]